MNTLTKQNYRGLATALVFALLTFGLAAQAQAQSVAPALDASRQAAEGTRQSQQRIDELDSRIQELLGDYRASLKQLEQLNRYNQSQQRQVDAQRDEIESLTQDINNIASLQRAVQPLMEDMVDAIGRLVGADIPFLIDERSRRVTRLQNMMDDPSRSPAQRYRLVIEAYQIEAEYGRTIEAYRSNIETDGRLFEDVDLLRVGRLLLIFKTDDDEVLKRYDTDSGQWVDLDRSFLPDVKTAMRVAREQIPPELIFLPIPAPADASEG